MQLDRGFLPSRRPFFFAKGRERERERARDKVRQTLTIETTTNEMHASAAEERAGNMRCTNERRVGVMWGWVGDRSKDTIDDLLMIMMFDDDDDDEWSGRANSTCGRLALELSVVGTYTIRVVSNGV